MSRCFTLRRLWIGVLLTLSAAVAIQGSDSPPSSISYASFLTWINGGAGNSPAHDTAELMSRMPRELRSSYTLVYETRSLHQGSVSALHPRVILFSPKGDLLVALSGDPGKPDFDIVEAIHFDPKTASFATSKFVLPAATERDPRLKDAARTNGEFNRGECTTCHGKDPRPIFDGYGLWPGFYGSRADTLSLHPAERRNYVAFLAAGSKSAQAPYRWLERPGAGETRPYLDLPAFPGQNPSLEYLPNTRLGIALTELNRQRIFRQIRSSPRYESLKYALTSGLLGCEPIPLSRRREKQVTQLLESENKARLKRGGIAARAEGSELFFLQELQAPLRRAVAEIVYVADVLEVDRTQWSMAFESGSLAFYDGVLNGSEQLYVKRDFLSEMLDDLARDDRRTAEALRGGWDLCGVLRDQIRTGASLPDLK